ncbi:hypothetical protein SAMN05660477_02766 [Soonwooa buanensis]|uniref:Lipoprotein n=1 Tax=Soonwooa buanensis TaxID=619805 RepID=A0A1T5GE98_9FLAO|nr:hypothetical protein [Soonwooa buanensis]SKC06607.1 hypothetical protein SAMN05660477_02766 [Soonwooa buanensis]
MKTQKLIISLSALSLFVSCAKSESTNTYSIADSTAIAATDYSAINLAKTPQTQEFATYEEPIVEENPYFNNSLPTGATPYSEYYGKNSSCNSNGCSQIKVKTPNNSDVLVTIKQNEKVVRHAYIQKGDSYTFSFPNGNYQAFFYYGKGWDPEKEMKNGEIKGGFLADESFGKDDEQSLYNNVLEYELILQQNGNFSTRPSNPDEAL